MSVNPCAPIGRGGGGQSVLIDGLSRALAAAGHRVRIYVRRSEGGGPAQVSPAPNVTIDFLAAGPTHEPSETLGAFATELAARWNLDPPDVVHAFMPPSGKAALAAARVTGTPVVVTLSSLAPRGRRRDASAADEQDELIRSGARIVATSSSNVFALLGLGATPAAIKFVPCGVDLRMFGAAPRGVRAAGEPLHVATLGGLAPGDGVDDTIEALALVEGADLTIGGGAAALSDRVSGDPDLPRLRALAVARGVGDRVTFHGPIARDEVAAFLRAADVVVCAPRVDSMGTVALEAMACGRPVIATTVGALADTVVDGMTGLHVPPAAPRQLAYALEALRSDPGRRERFGRLGADRTVARYGWARIAAETLEVYLSVTSGRARISRMRA